jgi:Short C-terminal domain/Phospholipase_D-nuclease N-terminal
VLANYSFGDVMWSFLVFFAWVIWFWLLITVFADVFRRHDIGGGKKALWIVFVILVPYLGVLIYLIAEHEGIADRNMSQAKQSQAQFDDYVKTVASTGDPAAQIASAKDLLDKGTITQEEFEALKKKALAA